MSCVLPTAVADAGLQGLSMYLFVFAFLGNAFYVASILTSPDLHTPESAAFLSESIPCVLCVLWCASAHCVQIPPGERRDADV